MSRLSLAVGEHSEKLTMYVPLHYIMGSTLVYMQIITAHCNHPVLV